MTVHAALNYRIYPQGEPPDDYPGAVHPDTFQTTFTPATFEQRRAGFIEHVLRNPAPSNTKPVWYELVRMAGGGQPHEGILLSALEFIDARKDCADFVLHGILRMLYSFTDETNIPAHWPRFAGNLSPDLVSSARRAVLNFKYFPDEPGVDSLCTWTENHYILYASAAYLAGQLYPDAIFPNSGETGRQKIEKNRPRILRWLDLRFRTGFSEWLSHVYYDEDLAALLSLHDFAADEQIRRKSAMVIDLILLDMALNSFRGVFGSTHGRAYENTKKWASNEGTTDTMKLLFGLGVYSAFDNMSAAAFALSSYRVPLAIEAVVQDAQDRSPAENYQRMGLRLDEMERWGLRSDNFEDGMLCLTLEAYFHPRTIANTLTMFDICNWWENAFLKEVTPYRGLLKMLNALRLLPMLARFLERDICRNTREEVNIYTYRSADYMLSTAQDYRKGYGGDQQHIWQATLGPQAVCFTTHPAKIEGVTPNYWAGSGLLPRAAQVRNLVIAIYNIEKIPALYVPVRHFFTHAWLPRDKFDEVVEQAGWIFARLGEGYLALRSRNGYAWNRQSPGESRRLEDIDREVIAAGAQNIWLCQMGRAADDGDFAGFICKVSSAALAFDGLNVRYQAPGLGAVRFGWEGPLTLDGVEVPLSGYPRYRNPYVQADFDPRQIVVTAGERSLLLDWDSGERQDGQTG
jgi:hypothetical protein